MVRVPNVANLVAAFDALSSVPERNFMLDKMDGEPFKLTDTGKCNTVGNAIGWIAQHPSFKAQGMEFRKMHSPYSHLHSAMLNVENYTLIGYNALSYLLGIDTRLCVRIFAPYGYPSPETVTPKMVCRRLKTTITKAGGKEALKALLDSRKPPKVPKVKKPAKKKAKKAKKKAKTSKKAKKSPNLA